MATSRRCGTSMALQLAMLVLLLALQMSRWSVTAANQDGETGQVVPPLDVVLPYYFALKSSIISKHLKPEIQGNTSYLAFSGDNGNTRMEAHQVYYFDSEENIIMIKAPNGHAWRRGDGGWIFADKPLNFSVLKNCKECFFKVTQISSNVVTLQSMVDLRYVKAFNVPGGKTFGLNAATATVDEFCKMEVVDAQGSAVTALDGSLWFLKENNANGQYLGMDEHAMLRFNETQFDIRGTFQVVPHINGNILVRSAANDRYWRLDSGSNWTFADSEYANAVQDLNCQFEPYQTGRHLLVLKAIGNGRFLKRYTLLGGIDDVLSGLNAATVAVDDIYAQMLVSSAEPLWLA